MKKIFLLLLSLAVAQFVFAQSTTLTGTVKNENCDPLHFAFIQDTQNKTGTYTDTLGNFTLSTGQISSIHVNCFGYRDTTINTGSNTTFNIVLRGALNVTASANSSGAVAGTRNDIAHTAFSEDVMQSTGGGGLDMVQGASFPVFNPKGETQGSRYLFMGWVHGFVVTTKDQIVQNPVFSFNYDKMGGGLLLTKDKHAAIEVNRDLVKSFTLYSNTNEAYNFINLPAIDPTHYVQALSNGKKYLIVKTIKTKFLKANYSTDGLTSTGNNYDSYEDDYDYYVVNFQTNTKQKIDLKKKSIKTVFAADDAKISKFISDHADDKIDETYLASLGDFMNQ